MTKNLLAIVFLLVSGSMEAMESPTRRSPNHEARTPRQEAQRAARSNRTRKSQILTAEKTENTGCLGASDSETDLSDEGSRICRRLSFGSDSVFESDSEEGLFDSEREKSTAKLAVQSVTSRNSFGSRGRIFSPVPLGNKPLRKGSMISLGRARSQSAAPLVQN